MSSKWAGLKSLWLCLRHNWQADRIRISPNQGRLLRLQPPALLEIAGERWVVCARHQDCVDGQTVLRYECESETDMGTLQVFPPDQQQWCSRVLWFRDGICCELEERLLVVYSWVERGG